MDNQNDVPLQGIKNYMLLFFKIIFLAINGLFLYKYGIRQNSISPFLLIAIYAIIAFFLLSRNIFEYSFLKKIAVKRYYILFCIFFALILFLITFFTDGNSLNVDRWSAMDVAIRALLNGEYPYTATDHLNGRTSNFPGLLILGIPFYLLGNVGYFQVFAFVLLAYTLYKYLNISQAFHYILLLIIAPAYWWEIFAISDLISNIILVMCFIILLKQGLKNIFQYPILLGISTSFLVLTRGIVAIPLVLLLFKDFWKISLTDKIKYVSSFTVTFAILVSLVLFNCPDWNTLKFYNPLVLQAHALPTYIHLIALALPFILAFRIRSFDVDFFRFSALLMLFPTIVAFLIVCYRFGDLRFDLSYLSIVIPFMLFEIVKTKKREIKINYRKQQHYQSTDSIL